MALGPLTGLLPQLRGAANGTTDTQLLDRFVGNSDADAFESIVRRHGPMVFAVCRRVLQNTHDAEDAFQATFLVLAYKAGAVSPRSKLAAWLHGVAHRTALKARHRAVRRTDVEKQATARSADPMPADDTDAEAVLDQELAALPDRYRLPILLCDLQGRLRSEVAVALKCSEGTLSSRLTRGRRMLADRLTRRGVSLTAAALTALLAERAAVAEALVRATLPVALAPATGAALVSSNVTDLATGVMKSMFLKKLQVVALAAIVTVTAALALTGPGTAPTQAAAPAPVPKAPAPALEDKATLAALADLDGALLTNRKVLKDIGCDIDQLDRIMDAIEAAEARKQQGARGAIQLLNNPNGAVANPEELGRMIQEANEAGEKEVRKAASDAVAKLLTPAQRRRLLEIDLQTRGPEVFNSPAVAKALDLTAEQKKRFAENVRKTNGEDTSAALQQAVTASGGNPALVDIDRVQREVRDAGLKRAVEFLTEEQQRTWKRLTGEPIKFPLTRPLPASTATNEVTNPDDPAK